jgi:protein-tyrosine phosphatase
MDWITDQVAIGNYLEAQDVELLRRHGFRSVLSLDGTLADEHAADLGLAEVVSVRLVDGSGNDVRLFRFAIESLGRLAVALPPVLVHCQLGRSRSAAIVAGYLMRSQGVAPPEAIALIAAKRDISIAVALEAMLFDLEELRGDEQQL